MLIDAVQTLIAQLFFVYLVVVVLFTRLEDATVELLLFVPLLILDFSYPQEATR